MKIRHKESGGVATASNMNPHGLGEIIVWFADGSATSDYLKDYDVWLQDGWVDMRQAFRDGRVKEGENFCIYEAANEPD